MIQSQLTRKTITRNPNPPLVLVPLLPPRRRHHRVLPPDHLALAPVLTTGGPNAAGLGQGNRGQRSKGRYHYLGLAYWVSLLLMIGV